MWVDGISPRLSFVEPVCAIYANRQSREEAGKPKRKPQARKQVLRQVLPHTTTYGKSGAICTEEIIGKNFDASV